MGRRGTARKGLLGAGPPPPQYLGMDPAVVLLL